MADLMGFNANEVEPAKDFSPLPGGEYIAAIVDSSMATTQAGTGQYLKLEIEILEGQYRGRKLWENLNLQNPSAQAVEIARGTLSAICRATGIMTPKDSAELHNLPMRIKVAIKKDKDGEARNRITKYESKNATSTATAGAGTTGTNGGGPAPWKQKAAS